MGKDSDTRLWFELSNEEFHERLKKFRESMQESSIPVIAETDSYKVGCYEKYSMLIFEIETKLAGGVKDRKEFPVDGFTKENRQRMVESVLVQLEQGKEIKYFNLIYPFMNKFLRGYYWNAKGFDE